MSDDKFTLPQSEDFFGYTTTYALQLSWDQVDFIVKNALIEALDNIERSLDPDEISLHDAISETLAYFTTKEERELLSTRDVPVAWLNLVAGQ